jgi:hypothetical protein
MTGWKTSEVAEICNVWYKYSIGVKDSKLLDKRQERWEKVTRYVPFLADHLAPSILTQILRRKPILTACEWRIVVISIGSPDTTIYCWTNWEIWLLNRVLESKRVPVEDW